MTENEMPSTESLAPLIDHLRDIADDELPDPKTLRVWLWDDGDFQIYIFHKVGPDEREQILYDRETGAAVWQHLKGASEEHVEVSDEEGTMIETEYAEKEERRIDLPEYVGNPE